MRCLKEQDIIHQEYDAVVSDNNGACITGNSAVFLYNWDMKKHKRVFYENDNTIAMPETLQVRSLPLYDLKEKRFLYTCLIMAILLKKICLSQQMSTMKSEKNRKCRPCRVVSIITT